MSVSEDATVAESFVHKWLARFWGGTFDLEDRESFGRPAVIDDEKNQKVKIITRHRTSQKFTIYLMCILRRLKNTWIRESLRCLGGLLLDRISFFLKHNNTYFWKKKSKSRKNGLFTTIWNEKILSKTKSITVNHFKSWFASEGAVVYLIELERHFVLRTFRKNKSQNLKEILFRMKPIKSRMSTSLKTMPNLTSGCRPSIYWGSLEGMTYSSGLLLQITTSISFKSAFHVNSL